MKGALYQVVKDGDPELISSLAGNSTLSGSSAGLNSSLALLQNLRAQEAQTQAQLNELSNKFGPAYPKLADMQASLDTTRKAIADETGRIAARVKNDYTVAQQVEDKDRSVFEQERAHAETLNNKAVEYQIARQEAEQASSLYQNLLQRMKEADLVADLRSSNITVVDKGMVSARPAKPNVPIVLAGGLFGGLILGICGGLLREATDRRIGDLEKLGTSGYSMPLAFIPLHTMRKQKRLSGGSGPALSLQAIPRPWLPSLTVNQDTIVVAAEPRSAYAESLRALRTTLMQSGHADNQPPQTIVVTSSLPGEGKSMLSANLAIVYAQRGKRVLLVDGDLRTPVLHKRFGVSNEEGLSDLLLARPGAKQIGPTQIPIGEDRVLHFLPAGRDTNYPAELLASDEMEKFSEQCRKDYDFVFIDAAPLLLVTDAAILGRRADFTLVVARHNVTDHRSLERTCQILRMQGVHRTGVVLNGVKVNGSDQYRYYGINTDSYHQREEEINA
jgi:capsular exopolysaccharide synthesis family protein